MLWLLFISFYSGNFLKHNSSNQNAVYWFEERWIQINKFVEWFEDLLNWGDFTALESITNSIYSINWFLRLEKIFTVSNIHLFTPNFHFILMKKFYFRCKKYLYHLYWYLSILKLLYSNNEIFYWKKKLSFWHKSWLFKCYEWLLLIEYIIHWIKLYFIDSKIEIFHPMTFSLTPSTSYSNQWSYRFRVNHIFHEVDAITPQIPLDEFIS